MTRYNIEISGPGMCINNVLYIIEKALKEAGFAVNVDNSHPAHEARMASFVEKNVTDGSFANDLVLIKMNHQPWGG